MANVANLSPTMALSSIHDLFVGRRHSICDRPARIICARGNGKEIRKWYKHGVLHRETKDASGMILPAIIIGNDWIQEWYWEGQRHRDGDLPALMEANGQCHRATKAPDRTTLPAAIRVNWSHIWYQYGELHRDDRTVDGKLLPAVIYANGECEYWIHGEQVDSQP